MGSLKRAGGVGVVFEKDAAAMGDVRLSIEDRKESLVLGFGAATGDGGGHGSGTG